MMSRTGLRSSDHGVSSENVSVDAHDFELLRRKVGASTLVDLSVDGGKARPVLVHSVQVNPISRKPMHIDLFAVRMTEELTVEVPLVGTGAAPAALQDLHAGAGDGVAIFLDDAAVDQ